MRRPVRPLEPTQPPGDRGPRTSPPRHGYAPSPTNWSSPTRPPRTTSRHSWQRPVAHHATNSSPARWAANVPVARRHRPASAPPARRSTAGDTTGRVDLSSGSCAERRTTRSEEAVEHSRPAREVPTMLVHHRIEPTRSQPDLTRWCRPHLTQRPVSRRKGTLPLSRWRQRRQRHGGAPRPDSGN